MFSTNTKIIDNTERNGGSNIKNFVGPFYKICTRCGKTKHIKNFNLTSRKYKKIIYKYRRSICIDCTGKQNRKYNARKKKKIKS